MAAGCGRAVRPVFSPHFWLHTIHTVTVEVCSPLNSMGLGHFQKSFVVTVASRGPLNSLQIAGEVGRSLEPYALYD